MADEFDWLDHTHPGFLHAYLVSPTNPDHVYDELLGVDWAGSSISCGYYTNTRTSGSLTFIGEGWQPRGAFVRIVYEIPEIGYEQELGTYAVVNDPATRSDGQWENTLELQSMLYTMSLDIATSPTQIAKHTSIKTAMKYELEKAGRAFIFKDPNLIRFSAARIMETGKSRLSRMFEYCSMSNNRLDVDGHGRVTVEPYIKPKYSPVKFVIDLEDPRGNTFDEVTRRTNWLEMPTTAAVSYSYSDQVNGETVNKEINAAVEVSATNHAGRTIRGYNIVDFRTINELSPATNQAAQQMAKQILEDNSFEKIEWELKTKYLPIWEGDVIQLKVPDGEPTYTGTRKCLVKNIDIEFPTMNMTLTLKETNGLDEED